MYKEISRESTQDGKRRQRSCFKVFFQIRVARIRAPASSAGVTDQQRYTHAFMGVL